MTFEEILTNVIDAVKGEIGDDISAVSGFIESQGKLLAKRAVLIGEARATGFLRHNDDLYDDLLKGMVKDAEGLSQAIAMHSIITIEKAWNAVAEALWGGMRSILSGAGVPDGLLPKTPPLSL